jgi:hypothetical protein
LYFHYFLGKFIIEVVLLLKSLKEFLMLKHTLFLIIIQNRL